MSFISFNSKSSFYPTYTTNEKVKGYLEETLDEIQKKRLKEVLEKEIPLGSSKISIQDFLHLIEENLYGCKGILFKGSINDFILDDKPTDINEIDVSFIAEKSVKVSQLEEVVSTLLSQRNDYRSISVVNDPNHFYCNLRIDILDISYSKANSEPRFRAKTDCREIDVLNKTVLFPKVYLSHNALQKCIKEEDIGCSVEELNRERLSVVAFFTSQFVQGRVAEDTFFEALITKILNHYIKLHKDDSKFTDWLQKLIEEYFLKHIPQSEKQARFCFLLNLILPAHWILETKKIAKEKEVQIHCLKSMWKVIQPFIEKYASCSSFAIHMAKPLNKSLESLKELHFNLIGYCRFYTFAEASFFQIKIQNNQIVLSEPTGKKALANSKKWDTCHLLIPKIVVECNALFKNIGESFNKKEKPLQNLDLSTDTKFEILTQKLSEIFKLSIFEKCKTSEKKSADEVLQQWKWIFKTWSEELNSSSNRTLYLNGLYRIACLCYALFPDISYSENLLKTYFIELAFQLPLQTKKDAFLQTYALPFLTPLQFVIGVLDQIHQWKPTEIINCLKDLLPWMTASETTASEDIHCLNYCLNKFFSLFLLETKTIERIDLDLFIALIKLLSKSKMGREKYYNCLQENNSSSLQQFQFTSQMHLETKKFTRFIEFLLDQGNWKRPEKWEDLEIITHYLLCEYSISNDEGIELWKKAIQLCIKFQKTSKALKYLQEMSNKKWVEIPEEFQILVEIIKTSLSLDHFPLIEEKLRALLETSQPNSAQIIPLLEFWSSLYQDFSQKKSLLNYNSSEKLKENLLSYFCTTLIVKNVELKSIFFWLFQNREFFKNQLNLSSKSKQTAHQLLKVLLHTIDNLSELDLIFFQRCISLLELPFPKSFLKLFPNICDHLLKKWIASQKNSSIESIEIALKTTLNFSIFNSPQIKINLYYLFLKTFWQQQAIPSALKIFSLIKQEKFQITPKIECIYFKIYSFCLEKGDITSLEKLHHLFRPLVVSHKNSDNFIQQLIIKLSIKQTIFQPKQSSFLYSLAHSFRSLLSNAQIKILIETLLQEDTKELLILSFQWIEEFKLVNLDYLEILSRKALNTELSDALLSCVMKAIHNQAINVQDLSFLAFDKMIGLTKDPTTCHQLVKLLMENCGQWKASSLICLAKSCSILQHKIPLDLEKLTTLLIRKKIYDPVLKALFSYLNEKQKEELTREFLMFLLTYNQLSQEDLKLFSRTLLLDLSLNEGYQLISFCNEKSYEASYWNLDGIAPFWFSSEPEQFNAFFTLSLRTLSHSYQLLNPWKALITLLGRNLNNSVIKKEMYANAEKALSNFKVKDLHSIAKNLEVLDLYRILFNGLEFPSQEYQKVYHELLEYTVSIFSKADSDKFAISLSSYEIPLIKDLLISLATLQNGYLNPVHKWMIKTNLDLDFLYNFFEKEQTLSKWSVEKTEAFQICLQKLNQNEQKSLKAILRLKFYLDLQISLTILKDSMLLVTEITSFPFKEKKRELFSSLVNHCLMINHDFSTFDEFFLGIYMLSKEEVPLYIEDIVCQTIQNKNLKIDSTHLFKAFISDILSLTENSYEPLFTQITETTQQLLIELATRCDLSVSGTFLVTNSFDLSKLSTKISITYYVALLNIYYQGLHNHLPLGLKKIMEKLACLLKNKQVISDELLTRFLPDLVIKGLDVEFNCSIDIFVGYLNSYSKLPQKLYFLNACVTIFSLRKNSNDNEIILRNITFLANLTKTTKTMISTYRDSIKKEEIISVTKDLKNVYYQFFQKNKHCLFKSDNFSNFLSLWIDSLGIKLEKDEEDKTYLDSLLHILIMNRPNFEIVERCRTLINLFCFPNLTSNNPTCSVSLYIHFHKKLFRLLLHPYYLSNLPHTLTYVEAAFNLVKAIKDVHEGFELLTLGGNIIRTLTFTLTYASFPSKHNQGIEAGNMRRKYLEDALHTRLNSIENYIKNLKAQASKGFLNIKSINDLKKLAEAQTLETNILYEQFILFNFELFSEEGSQSMLLEIISKFNKFFLTKQIPKQYLTHHFAIAYMYIVDIDSIEQASILIKDIYQCDFDKETLQNYLESIQIFIIKLYTSNKNSTKAKEFGWKFLENLVLQKRHKPLEVKIIFDKISLYVNDKKIDELHKKITEEFERSDEFELAKQQLDIFYQGLSTEILNLI